MTRILPRYLDTTHEDEQKLARILLETGEPAPPTTVTKATLSGDTRRLRGIPAIGYGVPGATPGTNPLTELLRNSR